MAAAFLVCCALATIPTYRTGVRFTGLSLMISPMSAGELHASSTELAQRLSVDAVLAEVVAIDHVSPALRAITLSHAHAERLAGVPGNDVMVRLANSAGHHVRRRYSVRSVNAASQQFTLWVSVTHEGAGAEWARKLAVGDLVDLVGPRGKIALAPLVDWHLFVGDTTGLGAFYRMAEAVETPGQVLFIVEIDHPDDAVAASLPEGLAVTAIFVDRAGRTAADPTGLLRGLAALELPAHDGHIYIFGELAVGRAVKLAVEDRGMNGDQLSLKAFWRAGVGNTEHGEPPKS